MRAVPLLAVAAALLLADVAGAASPASCGPQDMPETGLQGQVPLADRFSGRAAKGYTCNLTEVGFYASTAFANFDTYGNCAYYSDTIGVTNGAGGTIVLDVSDPRKPVKTDYLTARATRTAGESLRVNRRRGLLVADRYVVFGVAGSPDSAVNRSLAVYDVKSDCRHPKLLADATMPRQQGHEGCFQPDGMVYYMTSTLTMTPIDLSDPAHPKELSAPVDRGIHGCSTSDDGTRGYFADLLGGRLLIADTSEIQARKPGAQIKTISELALPDAAGQQSTIPLTYGGRPYVLDWSEFRQYVPHQCIPGAASASNFGYPALVDIADERRPRIVSMLKTEVMDPKNCAAVLGDRAFLQGSQLLASGDPAQLLLPGLFLYDSHYCSTDRLHDPTIAACANFASGIRVFDIRDPRRPIETAYFNPGPVGTPDGPAFSSNMVGARPVIRPDLGQIWFVDTSKGFHVLQFREGVWPFKDTDPCPHEDHYLEHYDLGYRDCRADRGAAVRLPSARSCRTTRTLTIRLRGGVKSVRVSVRGRRARARRSGAQLGVRTPARGRFTVRVVATTTTGRRIVRTRRYRACVPRPRRGAAATRAAAVDPLASARLTRQILALCRLAART